MPFLGFVLVTHDNPEQILFLCRRLSSLFEDPPIALHHDQHQSALDLPTLPSNVIVVPDPISTAWGKFSIVQAYLKALRLLLRTTNPQWIVSLSGADYPVKSPGYILHELATTQANAFLNFRDLSAQAASVDPSQPDRPYGTAAWLRSARERYIGFDILPYRLRKHIGLKNRTLYVRNTLTTRLLTPFQGLFKPYAGDAWHTIDHLAAQALAAEDEMSERLTRHYRRRAIPDESYFQTVLLNRANLTVDADNRRYTAWDPGARSPRLLTRSDIPAVVASSAHFARKFPFDPALYDAVDQAVAQGNLA